MFDLRWPGAAFGMFVLLRSLLTRTPSIPFSGEGGSKLRNFFAVAVQRSERRILSRKSQALWGDEVSGALTRRRYRVRRPKRRQGADCPARGVARRASRTAAKNLRRADTRPGSRERPRPATANARLFHQISTHRIVEERHRRRKRPTLAPFAQHANALAFAAQKAERQMNRDGSAPVEDIFRGSAWR